MPVDALLKSGGIFGVAVLALTACGSDDDEPSAGTTGSEEPGQESESPEEPDDQQSTPVEIGDDGVPDLAHVEEVLWENSASQDSVTIISDIPAEMVGIQEPEGQEEPLEGQDEDADEEAETDQSEAEETTEDAENMEVVIGGEMQGDGSVWQIDGLMDYVLHDNGASIYQTVESFIQEYRLFQPDEAAGPAADELAVELEAVGSWVDVSGALADQVETPQRYIESIDDEFLAAAGISSLSEVGFSGEAENREGQDVWVYHYEGEDEVIELVLVADEEEPLISELFLDAEDMLVSIRFTDWNDSEDLAGEEPDQADVVSEEELDAIGQSLM